MDDIDDDETTMMKVMFMIMTTTKMINVFCCKAINSVFAFEAERGVVISSAACRHPRGTFQVNQTISDLATLGQ